MVRICLLSILLLFTPKLEKKAYKIIAKEYEVDFVLMDPDPRDDLEGVLYEVMTDKGPKGYAFCLLYTSPSPRDATLSRMPSSA